MLRRTTPIRGSSPRADDRSGAWTDLTTLAATAHEQMGGGILGVTVASLSNGVAARARA